MDQRQDDTRWQDTHAAMTTKIDMVEERVQETMEDVQSRANQVLEGFKQAQETMEGAKSAIDTIVETAKLTVDEAVERVKTAASLIDQVQQYPWIMLGSAVLVGYILGGLTRETSLSMPQLTEVRGRP